MAIIRRKTRKKIGKQVRKLVKDHGPEVALGAATALVTTIINKATGKPAKKGKGQKDERAKESSKAKSSKAKSSKGGGSKKSKKAQSDG